MSLTTNEHSRSKCQIGIKQNTSDDKFNNVRPNDWSKAFVQIAANAIWQLQLSPKCFKINECDMFE